LISGAVERGSMRALPIDVFKQPLRGLAITHQRRASPGGENLHQLDH